MVAKVKKEETGNTSEIEINELTQVEDIPQTEVKNKKVKLVNRNDYDVFISYYRQEFAVSPQGEVVCDEEGIPNTLPKGVFKLNV